MATAAQLKALRKKYHLGEFRHSKKSHSIKRHRGFNMARKRRSHTRRHYSGSKTTNLVGTAVGVGGYILYEALLEPKVASVIGGGMILNVAELALGVWLSKKSGWIGNIGKAAVVLNAYQLVKPLLAGVAGTASASY